MLQKSRLGRDFSVCVGLLRLVCLLTLFGVVACAPKTQILQQGHVSPLLAENFASMPDGAKLPLRSWGEPETAQAIIVALHGFNDYSNAFEGIGQWLGENGVYVLAYDQRGFGATKDRGIWAGRLLVEDLEVVLGLLKAQFADKPLFILGESMGGAVAMVAAAGFSAQVHAVEPLADGLILAAPAVWGWSTMNLFYKTILWVSAHTLRGAKLTGESLDIQPSDNIEMLNKLAADPLVIKKTRIDAVYGVVGLMDQAYLSARDLQTPVLLLFGCHDEIIPKRPLDQIVEWISADLEIRRYDQGHHMLLRDLQAETVWRDILQWIKHGARHGSVSQEISHSSPDDLPEGSHKTAC